MKLVDQQAVDERAKTKKDGVYTFRGIVYRVRGGNVTHYAVEGIVLERCFGFNVAVGACDRGLGSEVSRKKLLQSIK